uniref:Uncharacterized protein n=1 Tax=Oryzias latipes TaxID=8090 RepID=A0A3P9KYS3_ORYLA
MALPTLSTHLSSRSRMAADQLSRRREQEARWRQQWELHARYFREQNLHSLRQAAWGSRSSFHQSMSAYHNQRLKEEKKANLEQRRDRLRAMLQAERDQLEAELRALVPDRSTLKSRLVQKTEELRTAREDRKKKAESALHKDYVVSQWQEQISEKKRKEVTEQEEKRHFENEYERSRKEALLRMKQAEERKKEEERKTAEELRKQMEELYLREEEWQYSALFQATRLKKEHFLIRQYRAQMKRRAQQVQGELEADRRILAALLEGEQEEIKLETVRRERAVADAAWMKRVIEEQLKLERQREAEFESLHREEAQRVWERREAQWEKERKARERLMQEVLMGRQQQLELKMQKNREAQEESLKRREELIQELELERELRRQEKEKEEGRQTARAMDLKAQMEQHQQEQLEEQHLMEQEEEENRKALEIQKQELRLEMQSMAEKGYQEKIQSRPRSAWT